MYTVPEKLKTIYKNDFLPAVPVNYEKYLIMYFPELDLTIDTRTRGRVDIDSFSLDESLCSNADITFGSCEASTFKIKIGGIVHDLTGKKAIVTQYVIDDDGTTYEMPFGSFYVLKAGKQSDMGFKELTCMDPMIKTDVDVSAWYNALTWPQTIKSMRESLLTYLGFEYEAQTITNDDETIDKTINPTSLIGREMLKRLIELNGGFGHFTRNGKFKVIQLSGLGLYPSEDLYPAEDLFPSESGEYIAAGYEKIDYEEYIVEQISSVTVREDDEDIGATAGVPGNPYIISGNFLLFGKSSDALQRIVDNLLLQVKNKFYRPHSTTLIGLPYMEVGDSVTIITSDDAIESFIFKRTLTGINAMSDVISAAGNQYRDQKVSKPTEIQQLKSKTLKIQKSVEGLQIELADTAEGLQNQISITAGQLQTQITDNKNDLQSQITQTAGQLQTQITDNKNSLQSQITQTAGQLQTQITDNKNSANSQITQLSNSISLKVNVGDVSSQLSLESGKVTLASNRLIVDSENFKLDGNGNATFSGKVTGATIESSYLRSASTTSTTVINGGKITSSGDPSIGYNTTTIEEGKISSTYIYTSYLNCPNILSNGNSLAYAGHTHSSLYNGSYQVFLGSGAGFASSNGGDLGSSTYRWGTLWLSSGQVTTSDRNLKHDIESLSEVYRKLILNLQPVRFKYDDGSSDRYHTGFIAQVVEKTMEELGIDTQDFGGLVKAPIHEIINEDGEFDTSSPITGYIYMLRYEEFISPMIGLLQEYDKRITALEGGVTVGS